MRVFLGVLGVAAGLENSENMADIRGSLGAWKDIASNLMELYGTETSSTFERRLRPTITTI